MSNAEAESPEETAELEARGCIVEGSMVTKARGSIEARGSSEARGSIKTRGSIEVRVSIDARGWNEARAFSEGERPHSESDESTTVIGWNFDIAFAVVKSKCSTFRTCL